MMLCKDFGLISAKGQSAGEHEPPKMMDLVEIFKKNSQNYKEMNLEQFNTALVRISEKMFGDGAIGKLY